MDGLDRDKDVIRLVTHSKGGAFGQGLKDYLEKQGWNVSDVLHLSTYESDEIDYSDADPARIIDYQNTDDPVIGLFDSNLGSGEIEGADIKIRIQSGSSAMQFAHRFPIDNPTEFWSTLQNLINQFYMNQTRDDIPPVDNSNKGEK